MNAAGTDGEHRGAIDRRGIQLESDVGERIKTDVGNKRTFAPLREE